MFQLRLRVIHGLVFASIVDLLLFNNFLMSENEVLFGWLFFPRFPIEFLNTNNYKFNVSSAKI